MICEDVVGSGCYLRLYDEVSGETRDLRFTCNFSRALGRAADPRNSIKSLFALEKTKAISLDKETIVCSALRKSGTGEYFVISCVPPKEVSVETSN